MMPTLRNITKACDDCYYHGMAYFDTSFDAGMQSCHDSQQRLLNEVNVAGVTCVMAYPAPMHLLLTTIVLIFFLTVPRR